MHLEQNYEMLKTIAFNCKMKGMTYAETIEAASAIIKSLSLEPQIAIKIIRDVFEGKNEYLESYLEPLRQQGDYATGASLTTIFDRINKIFSERQNDENLIDDEKRRVSGLVVGRVQSGKTRNYVGLMLKAYHEKYRLIFVLTSCNTALKTQTANRIDKELKKTNIKQCKLFIDANTGQACFDQAENEFNKDSLIWGVVIKQKDNLKTMEDILTSLQKNDKLKNLRVLIIDDEADNYSLDCSNQYAFSEFDALSLYSHSKTIDTNYTRALNKIGELFGFDFNNPENITDPINDNVKDRINAIISQPTFNKKDRDKIISILIGNNLLDSLEEKYLSDSKKISNKDFKGLLSFLAQIVSNRSTINKFLVKTFWRIGKNRSVTYHYDRIIYIGYTATPFGNLLNEFNTPLYPDFVYPLPKSAQYVGAEEIFGEREFSETSKEPNMPIVSTLDTVAEEVLKDTISSAWLNTPGLQDAIYWLICTAACRRYWRKLQQKNTGCEDRGKLWTTMILNISGIQIDHRIMQHNLKQWLNQQQESSKEKSDDFLLSCERIWNIYSGKNLPVKEETDEIMKCTHPDRFMGKADFQRLFPLYNKEIRDYPDFSEIKEDICYFLKGKNIQIIQINSTEEGKKGSELYATVDEPDRDIAWIVVGGNVISRGLTLEGLTTCVFSRIKKSTTYETLAQMGRWFGYRIGYELLPRLWVDSNMIDDYKNFAKLENYMHGKLGQLFYEEISPRSSEFNPIISIGSRRTTGHDKESVRETCEEVDVNNEISLLNENIIESRKLTETLLKDYTPELAETANKVYFWKVPVPRIVSYLTEMQKYSCNSAKSSYKNWITLLNDINMEYINVVLSASAASSDSEVERICNVEVSLPERQTIYPQNGSEDILHVDTAIFQPMRSLLAWIAPLELQRIKYAEENFEKYLAQYHSKTFKFEQIDGCSKLFKYSHNGKKKPFTDHPHDTALFKTYAYSLGEHREFDVGEFDFEPIKTPLLQILPVRNPVCKFKQNMEDYAQVLLGLSMYFPGMEDHSFVHFSIIRTSNPDADILQHVLSVLTPEHDPMTLDELYSTLQSRYKKFIYSKQDLSRCLEEETRNVKRKIKSKMEHSGTYFMNYLWEPSGNFSAEEVKSKICFWKSLISHPEREMQLEHWIEIQNNNSGRK